MAKREKGTSKPKRGRGAIDKGGDPPDRPKPEPPPPPPGLTTPVNAPNNPAPCGGGTGVTKKRSAEPDLPPEWGSVPTPDTHRIDQLREEFRNDIAAVHKSLKDYKKANDARVRELESNLVGAIRRNRRPVM